MTVQALRDFLPFRRYPGYVAVIEQSSFRRRVYRYLEMQEGVENAMSNLQQLGIGEGDKVVLWGENSARWMMTFYACLLCKIVVVPMDASFSSAFVEKVTGLTRAKLICSDSEGSEWNKLVQGNAKPLRLTDELPSQNTLLEIIFTSGTTGEPKGVQITHGNILANLVPIYEEYQKYRKYARPFSPIRFVHLIPLSHLFGQVMGLFIPQMLNGTVIYPSTMAPQIIEAVRKNRASVITCVPQELSLLRKYVARHHTVVVEPSGGRMSENSFPPPYEGGGQEGVETNFRQNKVSQPPSNSPLHKGGEPGFGQTRGRRSVIGIVLSRWWKYRKIHREFGWKFWAFIVGGATLPPEEEQFWTNAGFAVIQGYGMTETAPSITITHPFKGMKAGYVGKKLPGLEIKIAEDGEILVRGPHVTPGYYENPEATQEVLRDGWLHTGDLGRFDAEGNLQLLGRKKEVIVTSEGLNVYPDDVERVLNQDSRVAESAVVARQAGPRAVVHAILVLRSNVPVEEADRIISEVNQKLESFQRIQSHSIWAHGELPRTSTGKLKRLALAQGISNSATLQRETPETLAKQLLLGIQPHRSQDQDLGLSSLDRVELLMELESSANMPIDEEAFAKAKTIGDVAKLIESSGMPAKAGQTYPFWKWPQWLPVRSIRYLIWYGLVFRVMPRRMRVEASGLENLERVHAPVFFVSNHQSILDAPAILKALPDFRWRSKLAPAMGANRARLDLYAAGFFFNIYPLPSTSIGLRKAIELTGELVDRGYSPLVFPEGERTPDGSLRPFRPGIGVLVNHTKLLVVPIFLRGAYEIWPIQARGPKKKGTVHVHFGAPMDFSGQTPAEITSHLEALYRNEFG